MEYTTMLGIAAAVLTTTLLLRRLNQTGLSGALKRLPPPKQKRIVVMTGATTGLGVHTVELIAAMPNTRVIVGARGSKRQVPEGVEVLPLDLASLKSVREFADSVKRQLGDTKIDSLILNAGLQVHSPTKSADGFEVTFAVNHLAHYLLARLLLPNLNKGARLVIVTSDTHDPKLIPFGPTSLDINQAAHTNEYGLGVYARSKLCNIMTAHSFSELPEVKYREITVIGFNPGLTDGTRLTREGPLVAYFLISIAKYTLLPIFALFKPEMAMSTAERSGECLAEASIGLVTPPSGRVYLSLVKGQHTFPDPSDLAQNKEKQIELWRESAKMAGLKD